MTIATSSLEKYVQPIKLKASYLPQNYQKQKKSSSIDVSIVSIFSSNSQQENKEVYFPKVGLFL